MKTVQALREIHRGPDFIIYEIDEKRWLTKYRHALDVNCSISAFGFSVTVLLAPFESAIIEKGGDWGYFERRAREIQDSPTRQDAVKLVRQSSDGSSQDA